MKKSTFTLTILERQKLTSQRGFAKVSADVVEILVDLQSNEEARVLFYTQGWLAMWLKINDR